MEVGRPEVEWCERIVVDGIRIMCVPVLSRLCPLCLLVLKLRFDD